jgi:hypothetical protein
MLKNIATGEMRPSSGNKIFGQKTMVEGIAGA